MHGKTTCIAAYIDLYGAAHVYWEAKKALCLNSTKNIERKKTIFVQFRIVNIAKTDNFKGK